MKKRICFVVSSILTAKFFLREHVEQLSKEYDVYLVGDFSQKDIESISYFKLAGIKSIRIERKISVIKDISSVKKLTSYIKEMNFDAIHSLAPKAGLVSAISGKIVGTKNRIHVFTGQVWHTKKGLFRLLLKQLDKLIVSLNTLILVDSESQRDYLLKEDVINLKSSFVLGKGSISGVDLKRFYKNDKLKAKLKLELLIPKESVVFLFMGRINKDKGVYDLAHSFKKLLSLHKNVFLLFVGYDEGQYIENIRGIINNDNYFKYFGPTDFPENLIQVADVFCLPSYREGFGTSIIEASCCGKSIICSDTYGLRDTVLEGETGLKHEVGNVLELANRMQQLVEDNDLRNKLGNKGQEFVEENFSANFISKELVNFYKEIFNNKK
jgi:glycosyltransferase involved in cell wall biosynthesis